MAPYVGYSRYIYMKRLLSRAGAYTGTDMTYLASAGFWMNLAVIASSLLTLGLYLIFARVVPKEVFGTYQYLLSLSVLIGALTLTGMNSAVVRAVARGFEGTYKSAVRVQLLWSALPFLAAASIALYYYLNGNTLLAIALVAIGLLTPLHNAFNTYSAYLQAKRDFKGFFFHSTALAVIYHGALAIAAFYATGALILLFANLVSQTAGTYFLYRRTLTLHPPNTAEDPEAITYGKHLSIMGFFNAIGVQADNVLAFHYLGPAALAVYAFSTAIPDRVAGLLKFIPNAALPKLSTKSPSEIRAALNGRVGYVALGSLLIIVAYVIAAPWIYTYLFPAYMESVTFSQIYAFTILATLANLFTAGLTASGKTRSLYVYNAAAPAVQIGIQWAGVLIAGLWGLIIAKTLSAFFALFLSAGLLYFGSEDASK